MKFQTGTFKSLSSLEKESNFLNILSFKRGNKFRGYNMELKQENIN